MTTKPVISVITRTCERPELLDRCFASICAALPAGNEWIIVDDATEVSANITERISQFEAEADFSVHYVHSGMGNRTKALNIGLDHVSGTYVHFIDDDDTLAPNFYEKMQSFLEQDENQPYGAVACLCERIDEKRDDNATYKEISRKAHYPEQEWVSFASLATRQKMPLCSLMFRVLPIGALRFDESFETSEDHDFLLRFLIQADIAVLRKVLAFYHHRAATSGSEANSAISQNLGAESARFRNALMRRDLQNNEMGLGWLVTMSEMQQGSTRLNTILDRLYRIPLIHRLYQWLRR